jgi:Flp pilus assembly pilin Flp
MPAPHWTQKHMRTLTSLLWSERSGTTAIEYALIALLIGLVLITLQGSIGASVVGFFTDMANGL